MSSVFPVGGGDVTVESAAGGPAQQGAAAVRGEAPVPAAPSVRPGGGPAACDASVQPGSGPVTRGVVAIRRVDPARLSRLRRLRDRAVELQGRLRRTRRELAAARLVATASAPQVASAATMRRASLDRLAGGVAHDFNNILGVVLNYADFVREGLSSAHAAGKIDPQVARDAVRDLDRITAAAHRAASLSQQLLAFSGRRSGQAVLVDLNHVVREACDQHIGRDPRIRVLTRLASDLPSAVVDPAQLADALDHLIVNAIEAMPDGGAVTITTSEQELGGVASVAALPGGRYVVLQVADTGVGMSADIAELALEPFFTTKPSVAGAGLGLATVHGLVRQSGGEVVISSTPGVGTLISLYLPADDRPAVDAPAAGPATRVSGTVLVVDDEEGLCEATSRILRRAGYRVLAATSPAQALTVAADFGEPIDLLVSDVRMPGMSGPELADRMLRERPSTRVMFVSGYSDEEPSAHISAPTRTKTSIPPTLTKPFGQADLLSAVRELVIRQDKRAAG